MADAPTTPPAAPPTTPAAAPAAPLAAPPAPTKVADAEVDEAAGRTPAPVPYDRFRAVLSERKEAQKQVETLAAENKAAKERLAQLEAEVGQMRTETRRATARAETGIEDPADLGILLAAYDKAHEKTDEKKRPSIGDWKKGLAADEKAAQEAGLPTSWRRAYLTPDAAKPASGTRAPSAPPDRSKGTTQEKPKEWSAMTPQEKAEAMRRTGFNQRI